MDFFKTGFGIFGVIFILLFILVFATFIVVFSRIIRQKRKDDRSPRLTVPVTVVSRRADVRVHHHNNTNMHHTTSTTYYATFEVESGDRMELHVPATEYGLLIDGDQGDLTFQGSRFLSFERKWSR